MNKYKTFGEVLAFIREHLEECRREKLYFGIVDYIDTDGIYKLYMSADLFVTRIYSPELMHGYVVDVVQDYLRGEDPHLLIKVLT